MYEIPAAKLDYGEEPALCAERELSEETGYSAAWWKKLTTIATTPGFTDEVIHLYLAEQLTKHDQHTDEDEFIEVVSLTQSGVKTMLLQEEIFDAKTLSALCLYFLCQENNF